MATVFVQHQRTSTVAILYPQASQFNFQNSSSSLNFCARDLAPYFCTAFMNISRVWRFPRETLEDKRIDWMLATPPTPPRSRVSGRVQPSPVSQSRRRPCMMSRSPLHPHEHSSRNRKDSSGPVDPIHIAPNDSRLSP